MKVRGILLVLTLLLMSYAGKQAYGFTGNAGVDAVFIPSGKIKIRTPSGSLNYSDQTIIASEVYGEGLINEMLAAGISFHLSRVKIKEIVKTCDYFCSPIIDKNLLGSLYTLSTYLKFYIPLHRHKKNLTFQFGVRAGVGMTFFVANESIERSKETREPVIDEGTTYRGLNVTASGSIKINAIRGERAGMFFQADVGYKFLRAFLEGKSYMDIHRLLVYLGMGVEFSH